MRALASAAPAPVDLLAARVAERRAAILPLDRFISALDRALLPSVDRASLEMLAALVGREPRTLEDVVMLDHNLDTLAWRIRRAHVTIERARINRPRAFAVPEPRAMETLPTLRARSVPVDALVCRRLRAFSPVLEVPAEGRAEVRFSAGRVPLALGLRACAYRTAFGRKVETTISGVLRAPLSTVLAPLDVRAQSALRDVACAVGVVREVSVGDERFAATFSVSGDRDVAQALLGTYVRSALVRLASRGGASLRVVDGVVDVGWTQPFTGVLEETLPHTVLATVLDIACHFH